MSYFSHCRQDNERSKQQGSRRRFRSIRYVAAPSIWPAELPVLRRVVYLAEPENWINHTWGVGDIFITTAIIIVVTVVSLSATPIRTSDVSDTLDWIAVSITWIYRLPITNRDRAITDCRLIAAAVGYFYGMRPRAKARVARIDGWGRIQFHRLSYGITYHSTYVRDVFSRARNLETKANTTKARNTTIVQLEMRSKAQRIARSA